MIRLRNLGEDVIAFLNQIKSDVQLIKEKIGMKLDADDDDRIEESKEKKVVKGKKLVALLIGLLLIPTMSYAAIWDNDVDPRAKIQSSKIDFTDDPYDAINNPTNLYLHLPEVATGSIPAASAGNEGSIVYDATLNEIYFSNGAVWASVGGAGSTLNAAYDSGGAGAGRAIDVDSGAVALTVSDTDNCPALILTQNDATNDPTALQIVSGAGATGISIDIDGQAAGTDIEGTGAVWAVTGTGAATFVGVTTAGAATSVNANSNFNTSINTGTSSGAVAIGGGSGTIVLASSDWGISTTGVVTGIASIAMDAAAANLTLTSTGAAQDLTVALAGATDSSLVLSSTGTGADALQVRTTAGGIDITVAGAAAGEDLDLTANSSINIISTEGAADAIVINASTALGGIDISSQNDIDITTIGAAGEDITIQNTGGSVNITATEALADCLAIQLGGGVDLDCVDDLIMTMASNAGGDDMRFIQTGAVDASISLEAAGTGADAIRLQSSAGGIDIDAVDDLIITVASTGAADDLVIAQTGAVDASIHVQAAGTGADAISLQASAGGIDIDAVDDIIITCASSAAADDLRIIQTGAHNASISLEAAGTGADAIRLQASAGGIDIDAVDDLTITVASTAGADDLVIQQTGAQDASIHILAAGTGADAISLQASAGGIDIDALDDLNIAVTSSADGDDLVIAQIGAHNASVLVQSAGTGADAIGLTASAGGITIQADAAVGVGLITMPSLVCLGTAPSFGGGDGTPNISGSSYWETGGADTYTDFDTGGGTITEGTILIVKSKHAATFDVTGSGLTGGTADLVTADGDLTMWIYDGDANWVLISFTDMSDNLS
jgi:hypothetical protein